MIHVTDVLSLLGGYDNIPQSVLDNAAAKGKGIHKAVEYLAKGHEITDIHPDTEPYINAYREFLTEKTPILLFSEKTLKNEDMGLTGTIDLILEIDGVKNICDVKCTVKEMKTWVLQTAAYQLLAVMEGIEVKARCVLWLRKNGKYKLLPHNDYAKDLKDFMSIYQYVMVRERFGNPIEFKERT